MDASYSVEYTPGMEGMPTVVFWITYGVVVLLCIFLLICMWKIFTKAGEQGWKVLVPFYNTWTELKLFWKSEPIVPFILTFIPFVNIVVMIMLYVKMARSFGKSTGFAVGLILLSFIFIPILAFGDDEYIGPDGDIYARSTYSDGE